MTTVDPSLADTSLGADVGIDVGINDAVPEQPAPDAQITVRTIRK
jgi:hypothetical protein